MYIHMHTRTNMYISVSLHNSTPVQPRRPLFSERQAGRRLRHTRLADSSSDDADPCPRAGARRRGVRQLRVLPKVLLDRFVCGCDAPDQWVNVSLQWYIFVYTRFLYVTLCSTNAHAHSFMHVGRGPTWTRTSLSLFWFVHRFDAWILQGFLYKRTVPRDVCRRQWCRVLAASTKILVDLSGAHSADDPALTLHRFFVQHPALIRGIGELLLRYA